MTGSPAERLSFPPSWGLDAPPAAPLGLFADWMRRADEAGVRFPSAVTLSSASRGGVVSARTVLLKGYDDESLVFESESYSRKGVEIEANPHVAMTLYWREVHRQICVTGLAAPLSDETSDEMWRRRGRPNQAASVAAREGEPLDSVEAELELLAAADELVAGSDDIARPPTYRAYGLEPVTVEFWEGSADRLHRRVFYERSGGGGGGGGSGRSWRWRWRRIQP